MTTTGSKLLIGATVMAVVAAVVYGVIVGGALGTIGLSSAAMGLALLAGVNVYTRDADVSSMDTQAVMAAPAAAAAPGNSMWPIGAAVGGVLLVVGFVTYPVMVVFGVVVLLAATVEWTVQAWSERASGDATFNASLRGRMAHPLEFPVLGAIGLGVVIYSFSRIMLFLSQAGGPAAFATIAALILLVGFVVAFRPTVRSGAVAGVATIALVGLVAGGVAAALEGERELHPHETTGDLGREGQCDTGEETEADENASQTVGAKANLLADIVLHEDGRLEADALGLPGGAGQLVVARNNPTNVRFVNASGEERRLVLDLGTRPAVDENGDVIEDEEVPDQRCTALANEDGNQLLNFTVTEPSASGGPYAFVVPGVDGARVEVVVP
ncbi:MAG: hypothetical protein H0U21_06710 [Acidimicrobiia bacterium]|nr:hypothetical protein [Acidimicrobiia bacterium]